MPKYVREVERNVFRDSTIGRLLIFFTLVLTAFVLFTLLKSPPNNNSQEKSGSPDLYTQKGIIIAEGTESSLNNSFLKTFRVEEVYLEQPMHVTTNNESIQTERAWRVTVVGESFPLRAQSYYIWLDDVLLGAAKESKDTSEISVVVFERSILVDGATLSISYGNNKNGRIEFQEPLRFQGAH